MKNKSDLFTKQLLPSERGHKLSMYTVRILLVIIIYSHSSFPLVPLKPRMRVAVLLQICERRHHKIISVKKEKGIFQGSVRKTLCTLQSHYCTRVTTYFMSNKWRATGACMVISASRSFKSSLFLLTMSRGFFSLA